MAIVLRAVVVMAIGVALSACSFGGVRSIGALSPVSVSKIAVLPGGGALADAIAFELAQSGFAIVDSATSVGITGRAKIKQDTAQYMEAARAQGVDAVLAVRAAPPNYPDSAAARIISTRDNTVIASVMWQNAAAGARGSIADRTVRKSLSEAADEIARELAARMQPRR